MTRSDPPNNAPRHQHHHDRARHLRRRMTIPERKLWNIVRNRRLGGLKFRRQQPIGPFIADFACLEERLIVEVDGESHMQRAPQDRRRQRWLEREGYTVVRVNNDDVLESPEGVARTILKAVRSFR